MFINSSFRYNNFAKVGLSLSMESTQILDLWTCIKSRSRFKLYEEDDGYYNFCSFKWGWTKGCLYKSNGFWAFLSSLYDIRIGLYFEKYEFLPKTNYWSSPKNLESALKRSYQRICKIKDEEHLNKPKNIHTARLKTSIKYLWIRSLCNPS